MARRTNSIGSGPTADKIVPWGRYAPSGYVSGSKTEITNDVQFRLAVQDCMIKEPTLGACWESEYGQLRFGIRV